MRRAACPALLALALLGAPELRGQGSQPHLILSLFTGVRAGRRIWTLTDQPVVAYQGTASGLVQNGQFDTLDLERRVASGFVAGASGTYFPGPHIGFEGEVAFLGMTTESRCSIRQSQPPVTGDIDPEVCSSLQGQAVAMSAVSFGFGVVGRLAPASKTYPYARLNAGLIARSRSTIEMLGTYTDPNGIITPVTLVADTTPANVALHATAAVGLAFALGTGYQLRFEGRDVIAQLDQVSGRADPSSGTLALPHSGRFFHNFALTIALDVILQQSRRRRY
jgi:hypothetical protein